MIDAWVHENNYVYGILKEGASAEEVVASMNAALEGWDYPGRIQTDTPCGIVYVRPETVELEDWPVGFTSPEPVEGWVPILYTNAEDLTEEA